MMKGLNVSSVAHMLVKNFMMSHEMSKTLYEREYKNKGIFNGVGRYEGGS